jgi:lysophospholipase L1-like esterase
MRIPRIAGDCLRIFLMLSGPCAAQDEPVRVACVGDDITQGAGLASPSRDSYPSQLAGMLGGGHWVRNFGVTECTMLKKGDYPFWNETAFENALAFQPGIVILSLGTNDSKPWNWEYGEEFAADYAAMVDTFSRLPSHPLVAACHPPPAFGNASLVSDSVIAGRIIPMIDFARVMTGASLVDFNSQLRNRGGLFPDGIHPSIEGSRLMASIAYEGLTGIRIRRAADPDLAAGRPVTASGYEGNPPAGLNDGDCSTQWSVRAPGWAVIDLGGERTVGLFQTDFGADRSKGILYSISVSSDSSEWRTVVDHSADPDTGARVRVDPVSPVDARYVRLALYYGAAMGDKNGIVGVNGFHVRGSSAAVHAPLLTWRKVTVSDKRMRYEVLVTPSSDSGEVAVIYRAVEDSSAFNPLAGYEPVRFAGYTVFSLPGEIHRYYALAFKDGVEVASDTIRVPFGQTGIADGRQPDGQPGKFRLHPNYPNPFNAVTRFRYDLAGPARMTLAVIDARGRLIRVLSDGVSSRGTHELFWDGTDDSGNPVPSGVYICRLRTESETFLQKMLLLR